MKVKIKSQLCEISGCNQKAVGAWQPKGRPDKKVFICRRHREQNDTDGFLWKLVVIRKPEKVRRPKPVVSSKPKKEGKPEWQKILDKWFAKGKYPKSNFMSAKRWEYWMSIGGKKPEGDSRKFDKVAANLIHPLLVHKMNKHKKTKVRRKKNY